MKTARKEGKMANNKNNIDLNASCVNYNNVSQGVIHITEDKLHVILLEYKERNKKFYSWTTPFGIFLSCLVATVTSDFENAIWFSPDTWKAIFVICTGISGLCLLCSAYDAFNNRKNRGIKHLIEKIKNPEIN